MHTLLIIEDDPAMLRGLQDNFGFKGYRVLIAVDGEQGLNLALDTRPDLIILDIMLPKINGYEVCRLLRKEKIETPIIMLTAKGQEADVVLGLNIGADDYVTKPFSIRELIARVEAFLRRRDDEQPTEYHFGDCHLDVASRVFTRNGQTVNLTPREFEMLCYFLERPGRALTRDEILNHVWGYSTFVTSRSIDRFVTTLRNKIEPDPHAPRFILTVREIGYRFQPE
ncbi:MAG: response regulator transcription factor [Sedimentisphaerales bacterium]|nr:response regulator transcription factor [Sedimentisphaerales bacterium]